MLEDGLSLVGYVIATKLQSTDSSDLSDALLRRNTAAGLSVGEGRRLDQIYVHDTTVAMSTHADGLPGRGAYAGSANNQAEPPQLHTGGDEVDNDVRLERIYLSVTAPSPVESDGWREVAPDMVNLQIS